MPLWPKPGKSGATTWKVSASRGIRFRNMFDDDGLMRWRLACINDLPIEESDRKYDWPLGRRPDGHPGLTDLGF